MHACSDKENPISLALWGAIVSADVGEEIPPAFLIIDQPRGATIPPPPPSKNATQPGHSVGRAGRSFARSFDRSVNRSFGRSIPEPGLA